MTATYTGNPTSVPLDAIRLILGDTDTTNYLLTDSELNYFLTQENNNIYYAGHHAASAIAGKFSRLADKSLGPLSISLSQKAANYRQLSKDLYDHAIYDVNIAPTPFSGTSETGDRLNTDDLAVPPLFKRGDFDNPIVGSGEDSADDRQHFTP
jgi:hypothetical protein